MIEKLYDGNLFLLPKENETGIVTTNGIVKYNGSLVMGAGIAKYCRDEHQGIARRLGGMVSAMGNHAFLAGKFYDKNRDNAGLSPVVTVLSMPTKRHYKDASDLELIRASAHELVELADKHGLARIYLPAPGCSLGGLDYKSQVRPVISAVLDDRFTVCLPSRIFGSL